MTNFSNYFAHISVLTEPEKYRKFFFIFLFKMINPAQWFLDFILCISTYS